METENNITSKKEGLFKKNLFHLVNRTETIPKIKKKCMYIIKFITQMFTFVLYKQTNI